jgi:hypothetical protein
MQEVEKRLEAEREELNWLLSSSVLGRSSNLARMLAYVCEKHFLGHDDQISEHGIATEALGRRSDFDPQSDTIVRVVAHSLRKRLQDVYQTVGTGRPVQILIPSGRYLPSFIHRSDAAAPGVLGDQAVGAAAPEQEKASVDSAQLARLSWRRLRWLVPAVALAALTLLFGLDYFVHRGTAKPPATPAKGSFAALPQPKNTIRALLGKGRQPYVDHSGFSWMPGKYCSSGDSGTVPAQKIAGTEDPYLYLGGVRGIAHCLFPVAPGDYEVHFHFAETTDLPTATSPVLVSINAGAGISFDVVDHAGGNGIATSMVLTGVRPENDGAIHLDYTSEVSLLDAVEILPANSEALLPVRVTASPVSITDSANNVWLSDRYFIGGRRGLFPDLTRTAKNGIYSYNRIGRFRYDIPVVPLAKYRVALYFSEPWFGKQNSGTGGPGSRVFDVSCNGSMILKNFDIMAEGGANPVVKTFDNVQATAQGRIELSFIPDVNYPLVNAIEVLAEPVR